MKDALKHWDDIGERVKAAPALLLIMDFDGTLSPIAPRPEEAHLPGDIRNTVKILAEIERVNVALLSGRPVAYLKGMFAMNGLFFGGNHGLEMEGPGFSFRHEDATVLAEHINACSEEGRGLFAGIPGAIVENKGLSAAFHYRQVPAEFIDAYHGLIGRLKQKFHSLPIRWREGKKVTEALPRVAWDKGLAARRLLNHLHNPVPVVLGDDDTDEDMFRLLRKEGVTVHVGLRSDSHAEFYLPSQEDVFRFLTLVLNARSKGPERPGEASGA